ncbi:hypothetical protein MLGJGCBP_03633 [Rhodococcus sp. T7]|nr:hypothetical protein MLGJGCBP_03633 [Rhodococcus sp. T7]
MADHDQTTLVVLQESPQPRDRVGVEVVGRLVQQQGRVRPSTAAVRRGEQDPRQFDTATLTTRQGVQLLTEDAVGQSEAVADACRLALGLVSTEGGEPVLEVAVLADRLVAFGVVDDLRHQDLLLLHVPQQRVETARGQHPVLCEDVEVAFLRVLREVPEVAGADHGARVRLSLPGEDAEGGRLAGTVTADQPDAVAGLYPQSRSGSRQQRPHSSSNFQVGSGDQQDS